MAAATASSRYQIIWPVSGSGGVGPVGGLPGWRQSAFACIAAPRQRSTPAPFRAQARYAPLPRAQGRMSQVGKFAEVKPPLPRAQGRMPRTFYGLQSRKRYP